MSDTPDAPEHDPNVKHMADDINTPALVAAVFVTTVVVLIFIFGVQALYYSYDEYLQGKKVENVTYKETETRLNEQRLRINGPSVWVDREAGRVSIPIDKAMELVVQELGEQPESE